MVNQASIRPRRASFTRSTGAPNLTSDAAGQIRMRTGDLEVESGQRLKRRREGGGGEFIADLPPLRNGHDQPASSQAGKVVGDIRAPHPKAVGQIGGMGRSFRQHRQYATPGGVGESGTHPVESIQIHLCHGQHRPDSTAQAEPWCVPTSTLTFGFDRPKSLAALASRPSVRRRWLRSSHQADWTPFPSEMTAPSAPLGLAQGARRVTGHARRFASGRGERFDPSPR